MTGSANITSTDAVRAFQLALERYEADVRDSVSQMELELRRAVDWIEHDRAQYWPHQVRKASDAVAAARIDLERKELAIRPEDKRSCYDAKLALEQAQRRLRTAEEKVRTVRKWRVEIHHKAEEFAGELAKLTNYLDAEFPRALAALERMAAALDKYTGAGAPSLADGPPTETAPRTDAGGFPLDRSKQACPHST
jgi:hypothetical protein